MDSKLLGQRIQNARNKAHLSQRELAQKVRKDQRAISDIEKGKRTVWATDLPDFAQALHVPLLYFFQDELETDDLEEELVTAFRHIPTRVGKVTAVQMVEVLSKAPSDLS